MLDICRRGAPTRETGGKKLGEDDRQRWNKNTQGILVLSLTSAIQIGEEEESVEVNWGDEQSSVWEDTDNRLNNAWSLGGIFYANLLDYALSLVILWVGRRHMYSNNEYREPL